MMNLNATDLAPEAATGPRSITVLGSTGSIGTNTLELIESNLENYAIEALTAN